MWIRGTGDLDHWGRSLCTALPPERLWLLELVPDYDKLVHGLAPVQGFWDLAIDPDWIYRQNRKTVVAGQDSNRAYPRNGGWYRVETDRVVVVDDGAVSFCSLVRIWPLKTALAAVVGSTLHFPPALAYTGYFGHLDCIAAQDHPGIEVWAKSCYRRNKIAPYPHLGIWKCNGNPRHI